MTGHQPATSGATTTAPLRRQPDVDKLCLRLHDIVVGRAAQEVLDLSPELTGLSVAVLPTWGWALSNIPVGKKDRDPAGGRYLLPVRYTYSTGPVVLVGDEGVEVDYAATGMGHDVAGTIVVRAGGTATTVARDGDLLLPDDWWTGPDVRDPASVLADLVEANTVAYWDTLNYLERLSHKAIARAAQSLRYEVDEQVPGQMLDPEAFDTVKNRLVYGDPDSSKPSSMCRLIERCVRPHTFIGGDPGHYLSIQVSREAMQAVRSALGDPRAGSRIRRIASDLAGPDGGDVDPLLLIEEYRRRHPNDDRVQLRQVLVALTLRPSPHSTAVPLLSEHEEPTGTVGRAA